MEITKPAAAKAATAKKKSTTSGRSGATKPANPTSAPTHPEGAIMARVRPEDALWIANRCKRGDNLAPWIVAGVLAQAGEGVLRGDLCRGPSSPEAVLGQPTSLWLWSVINRDEGDFTEAVPVSIPQGERYQMENDAEAMRRDMGDWLGTLIMLGIKMVKADKNLTFMIHWRGFNLLAQRTELKVMQEGGKA